MAAGRQFTIGQLARAAQIPATTVRYYERIGLLAPNDRSQGNYRLYTPASLRRLKFIRAAQAIGFTLDDMKTLLGGEGAKGPSCGQVRKLIAERLTDIERRLADLLHIRQVLCSSLAKCQKHRQTACCHVVESLRQEKRVRTI
jgi:MerR family mercuric resistance operon transcriptional regulator